jgi:hypothetical protein
MRMPSRVELETLRESWLGIAGITENGDFGTYESAGDRALTVF